MKKRIIFSSIFLLCFLPFAWGQRHELGVQVGGSNLVGDIGSTALINPFPGKFANISNEGIPFYGGILYRLNFNPHQSLRFNLGYNHIQFNDDYAKEAYRKNRQLWGSKSIYEASAVFEYNFLPVNNEQKNPMWSPYIFGGVSALLMDTPMITFVHDFNRLPDGTIINNPPADGNDFSSKATLSNTKKATFAIPFGIGLKYKFNYNWVIFGEVMFRPTFSDAVDNSSISSSSIKSTYNRDILGTDGNSLLQSEPYISVANAREQSYLGTKQIGNTNSKDWVNTISVGISYAFGRPPCYCD